LSIYDANQIVLFKQQPSAELPQSEIVAVELGYMAYFSERRIHFCFSGSGTVWAHNLREI
jgi:hypothetical protein